MVNEIQLVAPCFSVLDGIFVTLHIPQINISFIAWGCVDTFSHNIAQWIVKPYTKCVTAGGVILFSDSGEADACFNLI